MPEAVATLPPAGAGRIEDIIYPGRNNAAGGGAGSIAANCTYRNGAPTVVGVTTGIGGGTQETNDVQLGVPCVKQVCTNVGAGQIISTVGLLYLRTSRSAIQNERDDRNCYRVVWMFRGSGIAPNAGLDLGLQVLRVGGFPGRIRSNNQPGFGVEVSSANVLTFLTQGGNGLQTVALTGAPFDTTAWHTVDFRITAPSSTNDGALELRLDDVVQNLGAANSSWAAGTNLPADALAAGSVGFTVNLVCTAGNNNSLWTHQVRYMSAQFPSALL